MKEKIKQYFKTSSKLKIAGDLLFYLLIILLLIPYTRREIMTKIRVLTLSKPVIKETSALASLVDSDYYFRLESLNGEPVTLENYRGEVMFVNFWATWCPPCRAEKPSIQRLYEEYSEKISFLIITSEAGDPVKRFIHNNNYTFPIYFQRDNLPPSFRVSAIPHTFVINREGEIVLTKTGAAQWDSPEFKELLERLL